MNDETKKSIIFQNEFYTLKKKEQMKNNFITAGKIMSILIIVTALFMVTNRSISYVKKVNSFNVNNLVVSGNTFLTFNDVIDIIGLRTGDNIFNINLKNIKRKLELHPRVKSAFVRRELPDKIIISLIERQSMALLNYNKEFNNSLYELDEDGIVIGEYPNISNYDLPVITGYESEKVFLGEKLNDPNLLKILSVLAGVEKKYYDFSRLVAEVNVGVEFKKPNITLYLNHFNTRIIFGEEMTEDKLNKLNSLLTVIGEKIYQLEYIDFKFMEAISKYRG